MPKETKGKMTGKRETAQRKTMRIAFCGMMTALAVVLMLLGGLVPVLLYVSPLVAGLLLLVVLVEYSRKAAWLTWLATALCILFVGVDKEAAFFYLFAGYYPILKWDIERKIPSGIRRTAVKLLLFTASSGLMYLLLSLVFPAQSIAAEFGSAGLWTWLALVVLMVFCLLLYDRALVSLAILYERRLRPKLKFLHR